MYLIKQLFNGYITWREGKKHVNKTIVTGHLAVKHLIHQI